MTKKHFEAFARQIADYRINSGKSKYENDLVCQTACEMVIIVAREFNPRFDEDGFRKACNAYGQQT